MNAAQQEDQDPLFQGDLLDCNNFPNEIILAHTQFDMPTGTSKICNSGRVHGHSLSTNGSGPCYTSQLHIMVSPDMIGKSITCVNDNGITFNQIGNFSIEQCHTTITMIAPSTGKLVIHM